MSSSSDVLVIGGGAIGLAIAVELKLRGVTVTVLNRNRNQAASRAAAGMLAPRAEAIPPGPFLELCLKSRWLYETWSNQLQSLSDMDVGYWPCGILAPLFSLPQPDRLSETSPSDSLWLDRNAIQHFQPGLGPDVIGGWWHWEDGQVDNRRLYQALAQACERLDIIVHESITVEALECQQGKVLGVRANGQLRQAQTYVLAAGSWSRQLLPLPVRPIKGQMLALRMPTDQSEILQQVLFGPGIYLVPRRSGELVIGATMEEVGWQEQNTPHGIQQLLTQAQRLYPPLGQWPIEEFWWGFRPGTPDELPILGPGPWQNLVLATGHYRNGILLTPITAQVIADGILQQRWDICQPFSWQRFSHSASPADTDRLLSSQAITPDGNPNGVIAATSASQNRHQSTNGSATTKQLTHPPTHSFSSPDLKTMTFSNGNVIGTTTLPHSLTESTNQPLRIADRTFGSRLMTGTGKYATLALMQESIAASGSQIVTVAVRRVQTKAPGHEGLAEALDWSKLWMLPNTAGCQTAEEAVRVARLGREMAKLLGQEDNNFVKLEVIPDTKYLLPDPIGTLQAAEQLTKEGFAVLPYINADPLLAKRLEEAGCVTVMPLGSSIGSGQGIRNAANLEIIIEQAQVPVVVDAGIGTPSEAAQAMELGADALLINSAIALAKNPIQMGRAMNLATEAGRLAYLAGRIPIKAYASASSPLTGSVR